MAESRPTPRLTLLAFMAAVAIGGGNFIAVRFSNEELDPLFGAALRFTAAAVVLFALARARGIPLPRGRAAAGAATYGVLAFGFSYAFLYYALVGMAAGTTSVIMASVPLLTLGLAVAHGQERLSGRGILGGALAIIGIAVLSGGALTGDIGAVYLLAALLGALAAAESSVVAKALPRPDPVMTNAIGMTAGAALLWLASLGLGETWTAPALARTWIVLVYLVVLGSVTLFILFLYVIARWTASATSYAIALMPVVAITLGAVLASEPITWTLLLGGALVLGAVYIGALAPAGRRAAAADVNPTAAADPGP